MRKVKILPKRKRAEHRVHEHGEIVELVFHNTYNNSILVRSLNKTFNKNTEYWLGWFTKDEASFKEFHENN
jgi:hypothetical protein